MVSNIEESKGASDQDGNEQDCQHKERKSGPEKRNKIIRLKALLEVSDKGLKKVKDSLDKAVSANTALQKNLNAANELKKKATMLNDHKYETKRVEDALDSLEQYTRKNFLKIHGIPGHVYINPEEVVH